MLLLYYYLEKEENNMHNVTQDSGLGTWESGESGSQEDLSGKSC
jgi:hypothetical protein